MLDYTITVLKPTQKAVVMAEKVQGVELFNTVTGKVFRGSYINVNTLGQIFTQKHRTDNSVRLTTRRPKVL